MITPMQNLLRSRFLRGCLICIFSLASSYGHGLGVLTINQEVAFELSYTHRGAAPLAVAEALADCDCVTVLDFPREIAPGETIRIPCVYRSPRMGRILAHVQLRAVAGGPALAFLPVEGVVVEPDWMVSASDLDKNEWSGARLIDIRDEADFARLRLPGALSAPRFSLAGRQDIGPAAWILYDQGYDPVSLLTEVALLRASGHPRVYALDGGLIGWLREGRAVQGLPHRQFRIGFEALIALPPAAHLAQHILAQECVDRLRHGRFVTRVALRLRRSDRFTICP